MKLREGRIGKQEGVCILCIIIVLMSVFTLNSKTAYDRGNTSYIWLPAGILLAVAGAGLSLFCMERSGKEELCGFYFFGLGGILGRLALFALAAVLIWQSFLLQSSSASALHSYVFQNSRYSAILFWIAAGGFYIAWGGLERISRSAKCVSALLAVLLLAAVLAPIKAFSFFRLFPFPGDSLINIGKKGIWASVNALPALLCLQCLNRGMQGSRNTLKVSMISAPICVALVFIVQWALALTYVGTELREMFMPMFRIDMTLVLGDYQLRQDKTTLFLWLMGAMPAAAFFEYGAAYLICKIGSIRDIRIPLLGIFAVLCVALPLAYRFYPIFYALRLWMEAYGTWMVWPPMLICSASAVLRSSRKVQA